MIKNYTTALLAAVVAFASCQDDMGTFDNKLYFDGPKVTTFLLKGTVDEQDAVLQASMAKPEERPVTFTYKTDVSLVDYYNVAYCEQAIVLPEACYAIEQPHDTIFAQNVHSNGSTLKLRNLAALDREKVYVLPVSIAESNLSVLNSGATTFFVFRGAALVNTAANITSNKLSFMDADAAAPLKGMTQLTAEALVKVDKFGKLISTLMGIEGQFLIRIGDAGVPDNQLQLATSKGNVTDEAWTIPTGVWTHIAVTFDSSDGATIVYLNGVKKGETKYSDYRSAVDWSAGGANGFYIGYSCDDGRYLAGAISECRIWNRILTTEELNVKNHFYVVDPASEGLLTYWKFDEGIGNTITDYTSGIKLIAANELIWENVSLPTD
jgi:hypothetical protein